VSSKRPLLIYDGDCDFCTYCVDYARAATGDSVDYQPFQAVQHQFPAISETEFQGAIQLVHSDGQVTSGARAAFEVLALGDFNRFWIACYRRVPQFGKISERIYTFVAANRERCYRLSKALFGPTARPQSLSLTIWIYLRLLALVYLAAFASFAMQAPGLVGADGIVPVNDYFSAVDGAYGPEKYWLLPSLFWFDSSAATLDLICWLGVALSVVLLLNYRPLLCLVGLYLLYLTLYTGGQVFMTFQWDNLLLECGFLAMFLCHSPRLFVWLHRWLLFRFMLQSGLVKWMSGDESWHDLSALAFHFETQPLPTALAWYADKLPGLVLQAGVLFTFVIELLVPFLILMPRQPRLVAAVCIAVFELLISLTGSYNYFNFLTVALCLLLLDDQSLATLVPGFLRDRSQRLSSSHRSWRRAILPGAVAVVYFWTSATLLGITGRRSEFSGFSRELLVWTAPLHMANSYGLFAAMTKQRAEIVIEGSADGVEWQAYELPFKPGSLNRAPVWATPHQPRLDWQLWFAALAPVERNPWFKNLVVGLLTGSQPVLDLFAYNPFPDEPPSYVRAKLYQYHFSDWNTRRETGAWWTRTYAGEFYPAAGLVRRSESFDDPNLSNQ
jgi:predicted DCC family thiol-disulfide oxidoreductase YuxK